MENIFLKREGVIEDSEQLPINNILCIKNIFLLPCKSVSLKYVYLKRNKNKIQNQLF